MQMYDSKIQDSKDFIAHLKHHIKNGNRSSVTQYNDGNKIGYYIHIYG